MLELKKDACGTVPEVSTPFRTSIDFARFKKRSKIYCIFLLLTFKKLGAKNLHFYHLDFYL